MLFIVGLGNPGLKFKKTRHNIGFRVLDVLQKENNFPKFKLDKKSRADISKGMIDGQEVILAKPQTFMNDSGFAVKALTTNYQLPTTQLIIIHDDFDLAFGEVKIAENSGSGGHHGVQSIIDCLKTQNFKRIRIGIRPNYPLPATNYQLTIKAEDFVLKKFTKDEEKILASGEIFKTVLQIVMSI